MIEYNERATQIIKAADFDLNEICSKVFGSCEGISDLTPLSNGAVNTTYKFSRNSESFVLRFYTRDSQLCQLEKQVLQLVSSLVATPELIYSDEGGGSLPFAVFRFVEGEHLFEVTNQSLGAEISFELGRTLAKIHQIKFETAGLFGVELKIGTLFETGSSPYYQYIKDHLRSGSIAWKRMGDELAEQVHHFIDQHKDFFPIIKNGGVLVHSDFKPVNLLWSGEGRVTVLDWEFAHSGDGLMDFAILLRHYCDFPCDVPSLEKGYEQGGCVLQDDWIKRARITDFVNIVQLLDSSADRPSLYNALRQTLVLTMDRWDELEEIITQKEE